jgi:hypothetical protein
MILIYLHIFTMFVAVALSFGSVLMLHRVAATGNVAAIRTLFGAATPIARLIPMIFGAGMLFGIIAAIMMGFNLLAPWLLIAYGLSIVSSIIGGAVTGRWAANVTKAAAMTADEAASPELQVLLNDRRASQALWINLAVIALIVFDMVAKPFGG